jgi:AAA domain
MSGFTDQSFSEGLNSWASLLTTVPPGEARWRVFKQAAKEIAGYTRKGLSKADAVDWLMAKAEAHGFTAEHQVDGIQAAIAFAFEQSERDVVPDPIEDDDHHPGPDAPDPKPNGQANGKGTESTFVIYSKADFVKGFHAPSYLIEGMLQRRFIYSITGATGHAKTAIALLICELVSSPEPNAMLLGHRVRKGRVVYFVGENPDDVRMRVIGADSRRPGDPLQDWISFIPGVFDIDKMFEKLEAEIERLPGPIDLVVVDTSAAYFLGNEELSNTQMGAHARVLRRLTTLPGGPCVLVLCHPIKHAVEPSQLVPRGGGAFLAEIDGNLTAWKATDMIVLHHTKMRGPGFEPLSFELETIRTDKLADADGRLLPTVRVVPITESEEEKQAYKQRTEEDRLLTEMLKLSGQSVADLARACGFLLGSGEPHKSKVQRMLAALAKKPKPAFTDSNRDKWELTEKGKAAARAIAMRQANQTQVAQQAVPAQKNSQQKEKFKDTGATQAGTACEHCHRSTGEVRKIALNEPGEKAVALHPECAADWFAGGRLPLD